MAVESPNKRWSYELQNAFLKKSKTFRTLYTFVKTTPLNYSRREERVLKKNMFGIELRNVVDIISCSICCPNGGDFIKQILRGLNLSYLKEIVRFSKPPLFL